MTVIIGYIKKKKGRQINHISHSPTFAAVPRKTCILSGLCLVDLRSMNVVLSSSFRPSYVI